MHHSICSTPSVRRFIGGVLVAVLLLAAACKSVSPPAAIANPVPAVIIELTDTSIKAPPELPAGIVSVTVKSQASAGDEAQCGALVFLVRLANSKGAAAFKAAMEQGMPSPDLGTGLGGICVKQGESSQAIYNLTPGAYLAIGSVNGPPPIAEFTVKAGNNQAATPKVAVKAQLVDFSFILPDQIKAGPQLWEISNTGHQWHEMSIVRLNQGVTIDKVLDMVMAQDSPAGPPPAKEITLWNGMGPGATAWAMVDLAPGEYYVVCFIPDMTANPPMMHASKGMVRRLKVVE